MAENEVNLEVDGVALKAAKGEMIIRVTDRAGIYVPRFCYHEKLSIAANCRMCLVEVEKAPKPLPACATPVAEGMKVFTRSPRAIGAQRATMEFLLINHPLDCPICDQGGECELQDLAVGFGRDISRYQEGKRAVADENLGPLVATDMTRCIQCTRCIRFTEEIAGLQELGMIGRGEHMAVRTYIESTVNHELSGNIIDVCPVGALVSKPYRFTARAWEMGSVPLVSPHDAVGSNLFGHVLRGRLMRVVPRENESINEVWIADRDRFSYEGVYSTDRAHKPLMRRGGEWAECDWETALTSAAEALRSHAGSVGLLASPCATIEELYLAARLVRGLGSHNIDHRLRQRDFRDEEADPPFPGLGLRIAEVDSLNALLLVGSNLRREAPILAHRVRRAALRGAQVAMLNPARFPYLFPVKSYLAGGAADMVADLAAVLAAAAALTGQRVPVHLESAVQAATVDDAHRAAAQALLSGERRAVWLGALAARHPAFADLRALAAALAQLCGASFGRITEGANAAGAYLAGAIPHRAAGAKPVARPGRNAREMLSEPLRAYVLLGVEPSLDSLEPESVRMLGEAQFVLAISPFASEELKSLAHLLLPVGTFAESSGTYVNCEGVWQSQAAAAALVGEARPAWKVLRVLGNALQLDGFDYQSSADVLAEVRCACESVTPRAYHGSHSVPPPAQRSSGEPIGLTDIPMYHTDALVRRAASLQRTREGRASAVSY